MNLLDIDVYDSIPDIVNAYTKVFGTEYKDIIEKRINSVIYITYKNPEGMYNYIQFLKRCKEKELAIRFLEKIGVDVSKDCKKYADRLDENLDDLIDNYMGSYLGINSNFRIYLGVRAWLPTDKNTNTKEIIEAKIEFINFFRGKNGNLITEENFQEFCKTDEYKKIYDEIQEYLQILEQLSIEYKNYLQSLEPYQEYVDNEQNRRNDMEIIHTKALYEKTEKYLTEDLKNLLDEKYSSIDEKSKTLFDDGVSAKSCFEFFSKESENKLNDSSISQGDKSLIYYYRTMYFKKLGFVIENEENFKTEEDKYNYIIQQNDIQNLILPEDNIREIISLKNEALKEFQKDFIYSSEHWLEKSDNLEVKEWIYERIINKVIGISGICQKGEFRPALFFTVRNEEGGTLDYLLLHELCHVCETEGKETRILRCGFDLADSDTSKNPYNSAKRKYERLNETITDIFTVEAMQILHQEGIYIFEKPEYTIENVNDRNTTDICKNLLKPFVKEYREQIIRARILGDMKGLYEVIGKENFEELNDIINKVDSLERLTIKLKKDQREDPTVIEYYRQVERLNKLYYNMQNYQKSEETTDVLVKSAISATEATTRNSQIDNAMITFTKHCEYDTHNLNIERD